MFTSLLMILFYVVSGVAGFSLTRNYWQPNQLQQQTARSKTHQLHAEVTIILKNGEQKKIDVKPREFLLLAMEDAKIQQRFVCRTGTCSACAVRVTNGPASDFIELEDEDYVSSKKVKLGYTLSCVAFVTKPGAIIEINQETAYDDV